MASSAMRIWAALGLVTTVAQAMGTLDPNYATNVGVVVLCVVESHDERNSRAKLRHVQKKRKRVSSRHSGKREEDRLPEARVLRWLLAGSFGSVVLKIPVLSSRELFASSHGRATGDGVPRELVCAGGDSAGHGRVGFGRRHFF
mmetsp:Transcript_29427/g.90016  ORF Transcript_29427/g.90016 Transcript_29427/m.90016 type:complete len:144 (-) Transcript_29427:1045-1476(-)